MKQLEIFDEAATAPAVKRTKAQVFEDYNAFVAKFKKDAKKTTDDCFTPQPVFEAVLSWLSTKVDLTNKSIVRPFYPGGDYKNYEYPEDCVVVDNPPFSILTRIIRFYCAARIPFFLFAPHLTLFIAQDCPVTYIVTAAGITYANGAVVNTGFISNLFPGVKIMLEPTLRDMLRGAQEVSAKRKTARVCAPANVYTSALLGKYVGGGVLSPMRLAKCTRTPDCLAARTELRKNM